MDDNKEVQHEQPQGNNNSGNKKKSNKITNIVIIIIIIVIIILALTTKKKAGAPTETNTNNNQTTQNAPADQVTVNASDGTNTVEVIFNNSTTSTSTVTFSWAGQSYTLPRALSGSGARYSNSWSSTTDGMQLWEHQGEITISNDGETLFVGQEQVTE